MRNLKEGTRECLGSKVGAEIREFSVEVAETNKMVSFTQIGLWS